MAAKEKAGSTWVVSISSGRRTISLKDWRPAFLLVVAALGVVAEAVLALLLRDQGLCPGPQAAWPV